MAACQCLPAGPVVLVVDCPSEAFVAPLTSSPALNHWAKPENRSKGEKKRGLGRCWGSQAVERTSWGMVRGRECIGAAVPALGKPSWSTEWG